MDAIVLKNISKKYTLSNNRPLLVKSFFSHNKQEKWALKNISLTINKGESVGIIGKNGSGKSTLLKIITGIIRATKGTAKTNGRIASLIELGAGFHSDLTGKENVYLNGTLLGLTTNEIASKFKRIIEFAGIGRYIDQPIRTYSSGMTVRLGFAVAIHLEPDILLIDEILTVGDASFQKKCIAFIKDFHKTQGKTLVIVSHDLYTITHLCTRAILFDHGNLITSGKPSTITKQYLKTIDDAKEPYLIKKTRYGTRVVEIIKSKLIGKDGREKRMFNLHEPISFLITIRFHKNISEPVCGITLRDEKLTDVFATNNLRLGIEIGSFKKGELHNMIFSFPKGLPAGTYYASPAVASSDTKEFFDWLNNQINFTVGDESQTPIYLTPHSFRFI